ncbi:hypothetical protein ACLOJK_007345 [Asimina triloba]
MDHEIDAAGIFKFNCLLPSTPFNVVTLLKCVQQEFNYCLDGLLLGRDGYCKLHLKMNIAAACCGRS